jgi:predicted NUDIX family NTP pyrophosphohydrolase
MQKKSAGLLLYRRTEGGAEVLLVHPGGPFFKNEDAGAWSIPKGELAPDEPALAAARREFREETGFSCEEPFVPLGEVRLASGKRVVAWAFEGDCDPAQLRSNTFSLEWPPKSGRLREFPEVDRAAFFGLAEAARKIHRGQLPLLDAFARELPALKARRRS